MIVTVSGAASATIYNVTCTLADTEYSQALGNDVKWVTMQPRTNVDVRFAFETGMVATPTAPYGTMKVGAPFGGPGPNGGTVYVGSATAGTVVEIVVYV